MVCGQLDIPEETVKRASARVLRHTILQEVRNKLRFAPTPPPALHFRDQLKQHPTSDFLVNSEFFCCSVRTNKVNFNFKRQDAQSVINWCVSLNLSLAFRAGILVLLLVLLLVLVLVLVLLLLVWSLLVPPGFLSSLFWYFFSDPFFNVFLILWLCCGMLRNYSIQHQIWCWML